MAFAAMELCQENARNMSDRLMVGIEIQTISKGSKNLTRNTEVIMPINRNLLRHNMLIVFNTEAFTTALSTLLMTSNTTRPITIAMSSTNDTVEARPIYGVDV